MKDFSLQSMIFRITSRRKSLGLTQRRLSAMIGMSPIYICTLEKRSPAPIPSAEVVAKICGVFGCTANWLLFGE